MFGFKLSDDFLIGTANAAFQCEGAWDRDGKSPSVMDYYAEKYAGVVPEQLPGGPITKREGKPYTSEVPDRGCFFYDHYEEYIEDMAKTGQNVYRLSIAWPRIIPTGYGEVNPKGIEFYNKVINKLLEHNITPFVDILHWDLPQCLMEEGGYANPNFPDWYEAFAKVCFESFGDRVKLWSTFNECDIAVARGYGAGTFPPFQTDFENSLVAAQNCFVAHFRAVRLYKSLNQGGKIGAVNCITPITPVHLNEEDLGAVERQMEWRFGWWTTVMLEGHYPQRLFRECPEIKAAMPAGYQDELDKWFIPMDFIGINYYSASRTQYNPNNRLLSNYVSSFYSAPGQQFTPYPPGLLDVLQYVSNRYHNIPIYITENGCALPNVYDKEKECDDPERIKYIREHLRMCVRAQRMGINLKGYFYWNDADSYEELDGYRIRFGLTWVNHETGERVWKKSRHYFSEVCKTRMVD